LQSAVQGIGGNAYKQTGAMSAAAHYAELSRAVTDLRERGLQQSAKWAAEMLCGLPADAATGAADALAADAAASARAPDPPALLLARACFADRVSSSRVLPLKYVHLGGTARATKLGLVLCFLAHGSRQLACCISVSMQTSTAHAPAGCHQRVSQHASLTYTSTHTHTHTHTHTYKHYYAHSFTHEETNTHKHTTMHRRRSTAAPHTCSAA
jgi:hypothetical protein